MGTGVVGIEGIGVEEVGTGVVGIEGIGVEEVGTGVVGIEGIGVEEVVGVEVVGMVLLGVGQSALFLFKYGELSGFFMVTRVLWAFLFENTEGLCGDFSLTAVRKGKEV